MTDLFNTKTISWEELKAMAVSENNWRMKPVWIEINGAPCRYGFPCYYYENFVDVDGRNLGECIEILNVVANLLLRKDDIGKVWQAYKDIID